MKKDALGRERDPGCCNAVTHTAVQGIEMVLFWPVSWKLFSHVLHLKISISFSTIWILGKDFDTFPTSLSPLSLIRDP